MQVSIKKWGNSASVRIPASIMRAAHIDLDQLVDIREEDGRLIIEPVEQPQRYALADLVDGITPENQHSEVSVGGPVGKEIW